MVQTAQELVQFDRFVLDLKRSCLRMGEREIGLRPKAFEVLTHLALNAGRLVKKQELLDTAWAGVVVSEESLAQCIREIRRKLGDDAHRLIKTVPRRGYLLDAIPVTTPSHVRFGSRLTEVVEHLKRLDGRSGLQFARLRTRQESLRIWLVVGAFFCVFLAATQFFGPRASTDSMMPLPPPKNRLFTEDDAKRVATIASDKQLPLPAFQIREPSRDLPKENRRFIGVWVSDTGWMLSHRQLMLIVTQVDPNGSAIGYTVDGPPQPKSPTQTPAGSHVFQARISGDSLFYDTNYGRRVASFTSKNSVELQMLWRDGKIGAVSLNPVWTQVEADSGLAGALRLQ